MAYTYRASSSAGNASGAGVTLNKPTGTADGDLLVVVAYLEADTNTWSSVGSGFSSITTQANTGSFLLQVWWKWAASEPASWTWTPTSSNWRTVVCAAYSGGGGSGSVPDVSGGSQGDGINPNTSQTAPSVTTTAANDMLTFAYGNFNGNNVTATTGAATNLRISFGGVTIADATIATASATGTTAPSAGAVATEDYAAIHAALFLSPGGGAVTLRERQYPRGVERGIMRGAR
jgi:hypothetical protein